MKKLKAAGAVMFYRYPKSNTVEYLLLLANKEPDYWNFVKGRVDLDDKDREETAKREISEETGLNDIKFFQGFLETDSYVSEMNGEIFKKEVIWYLAETKTKKVNLSIEHDEFKWAEFDEAMELLKYDNSKRILEKANRFIKSNDAKN